MSPDMYTEIDPTFLKYLDKLGSDLSHSIEYIENYILTLERNEQEIDEIQRRHIVGLVNVLKASVEHLNLHFAVNPTENRAKFLSPDVPAANTTSDSTWLQSIDNDSGDHRLGIWSAIYRAFGGSESDRETCKRTEDRSKILLHRGREDRFTEALIGQIEPLIAVTDEVAYAEIPLSLFLNTNDDETIDRTERALIDFCQAFGIECFVKYTPVWGSFFRKLIGKSDKVLTHEEVRNITREIVHTLNTRDETQSRSENDLAKAKAAKALMEGIGDSEGVALVGSILIVARFVGGARRIVILSLTPRQLLKLADNPELLSAPERILKCLTSCADNPDADAHADAESELGDKNRLEGSAGSPAP